MAHFTYCDPNPDELLQGDVLRTDGVFWDRIPAMGTDQRLYGCRFMQVVTQSCDMVRRDGRTCKASHIALAPVFPLEVQLEKFLAGFQFVDIERRGHICSKKQLPKFELLVERLLNNNESGYFYLHGEPTYDFHESMVACLRQVATIPVADCYEVCLEAKSVQLAAAFRAKLGWLVGDLYSRVGTPDWQMSKLTQMEYRGLKKSIRYSVALWATKEQLLKAEAEIGDSLGSMSSEEIQDLVGGLEIPTRKQSVLSRTRDILAEQDWVARKVDVDRLVRTLENDHQFTQLLAK